MALSKQVSTIHVCNAGCVQSNNPLTGSDWIYTFTVNNASSDLGAVYYNSSYDEAVDGSLRQNLRGFRLKTSLNWEKIHSSTISKETSAGTVSATMGDFFDDLIVALVTNGDANVEISFDSDSSDGTKYEEVVPENLVYMTSYRNQIGRGRSDLSFIGRTLLTTIPEHLEAPSI